MEQHEYATGPGEVPVGVTGGRGAGAGQLTAYACVGVHGADSELQALAQRLAEADPAAAHDLFTAAFGLYGARHFGGTVDAGGTVSAGTSWWHGPTVDLPALLRSREGRPVRGLRRARRTAVGLGPGSAAGTRGRHRKPERSPGSTPHEIAVERRTAARLLVAHPLVTAAGPHGAGFPLIRRHADWLAERFLTVLGYPLTIGDSYARLHKAGLPGRGLPGFGPAGYASLVLALAALADGREAELDEPGVRQVLQDWQVLVPGEQGRLTVDRELARALGPLAAPPAATPELSVRRRLAETPVVLLDELTAPERSRLLDHRQAEAELFADFLGLEAEIRAEGIALLDPADELTDLALPGAGTLPQAALLLVERLVEELRPLPEEAAPPAVLVPDALIDGALGDITDEYGLKAGWSRDYLADLTAFRRDALDLLHRMDLIAPAGRAWLLRAPAARYAPRAELHPAPGSGRHSRPAPLIPAPGRSRTELMA
ncbi:hypothetical protein GCM10010193_49230 [Kitasatospora atroaurantiaca]|uniref:Uncharacterized protein (TIGR02678 family) n=1 Tax=Kitasatospora atroaurantiaca TaxID=285545 RepID=A0A561EYL7_9ACTN|nr:DUF2398 family protein [Kitasatospora atroaurantiaca]TWE20701.1 uncharacterized protein (TIGR02678 family) [Kitasatospora atroaurantiaca]